MPFGGVLTRSVQTDSDERSFGGSLPLVGDVTATQGLPVVESLPLQGATAGLTQGGRALPSLPLAAPAGLPFVLPVPGVAQPRTAAPAVPPLALSGLNVNPVQGGVGPTRFTEAQAPALAGIDARSLFNPLEDTAVMPRI